MSAAVPLVVVGAGGFGREALDVIEAANRSEPRARFTVLGVVDDAPSDQNLTRLADRGYSYLGASAEWAAGPTRALYVLAIGSPGHRARMDAILTASGREPASVIHPAACVGSRFTAEPGLIICAGVQVSTNVMLGRHVHLNPNATIGHDAALGDYVSVNPAAVVSGDCSIGPLVLLGANSITLQKIAVGARVIVGAGACVTRDVDPGRTIKGVPAR